MLGQLTEKKIETDVTHGFGGRKRTAATKCVTGTKVYINIGQEEKKNRIFITPSWRCTDPAEPF